MLQAIPHVFLICASVTLSALAGESNSAEHDEIKRKVYASILPDDAKGFIRKGAVKPGDWLATHPEPPESLNRYIFQTPIRPTQARRTIVLQPLGEMNAEQLRVLDALREYAEIFFQLPARIEKPLPLNLQLGIKNISRKLPIGLRRPPYENQFNADAILDSILRKKLPADAVAYLGITMEDLYSGELNYVFGLGSLKERVGVYSLCRYFPEFWNQRRTPGAEKLALLRSFKVLNHEMGHVFGMPHCVFYECSMNGSNSLPETDAAPIHFCPVCHRKLKWNIDFDASKRFKELQAFYSKHDLKAEAEFISLRAQNWAKAEAQEKIKAPSDE